MYSFKNISSVTLLVILTISIFFNLKNCSGDDRYEALERANKSLQCSRDSLIKINDSLQINFNLLQDSINKREKIISDLNNELSKSNKSLDFANSRVSDLEKEKRDINKKIKELLKNPIKRDGDLLINSLKNKLK